MSVHYTHAAPLTEEPMDMDRLLMETPYEDVLAALVLDTKLNLRFIRTGNRAEGARVAMVNVRSLIGSGRHWIVGLRWDPEEMEIAVHDQDEPGARVLRGRWPR